MALAIGTRIGTFEITGMLGAGGMGEVYRARDRKLDRDVAIKVLPDSFASDPERLARFEREAKTLAALNHPNIAQIYGVEEGRAEALHPGPAETGHYVRALVLELVEGETLAERIARSGRRGPSAPPASGPAVSIAEAIVIARQIIDALDAAHEKGIVHRDLKPANIKITPDGVVKVLDFGLAKSVGASSAGGASAGGTRGDEDVTYSPTLSLAATAAGVILGTAAYMSPEQAKGRDADKRGDIWAFGCVLYEMLAGRRVFDGEDLSETLALVLTKEPDWNALPKTIPAPISRLLRRCLARDRTRRLADIADARFEIEEVVAAATNEVPAETGQAKPRRGLATHTPAFFLGALVTALAGLSLWVGVTAPATGDIARFEIPDQTLFVTPNAVDVALTMDGRAVIYRATPEGRSVLMRRRLDRLEAEPLVSGGPAPTGVFVSPDGNWVGFQTAGAGAPTLQKVSVQGGLPIRVAEIDAGFAGATWGTDDTIVYATRSGLWRVSANGGDPELLVKRDGEKGEDAYRWPHFLPNGRFILFTSVPLGRPIANAHISVLSLQTLDERVLVRGGTYPRYVASGHLVYGAGGMLRAQPFDADRAEVTGSPVVVVDDVLIKGSGAVDFDVAPTGALVYLPAAGASSTSVSLVDRKGTEQAILQIDQLAARPRFSPDGARFALQVPSDAGFDIWVYEVARGTGTRLTVDGSNEDPVWTPDGTRLVFGRADAFGLETDLFWAPWDGSGKPEPLLVREGAQSPHVFTPDGRSLAFYERQLTGRVQRDIYTLSIDAPQTPTPLLVTPFNERSPSFSPDGRWVAYASDDSGQDEIYVRAYPGSGGRQAVSKGGGTEPHWASDGKELFYRRGQSLVAVQVKTGPTLGIGSAVTLFEAPYVIEGGGSGSLGYDVSRDGQRFLMLKRQTRRDEGSDVNLRVVLNWLTELTRLVPTN